MKKTIPLRDITLFILMAVLVLLFWRNNLLATVFLSFEFLISAIIFYNKKEKLFFILTGVFGVILETLGGLVGIWTYASPNFITVPVWIFFCWGFTFMFLRSIVDLRR